MNNFLAILRAIFITAPLGILLSILRLIFFLLLLFPALLARLIEWLKWFWKKRNFKEEEKEKDCNPPFPEEVMRRPDPCIYSQQYLASQGVSVTWNNPDIWLAKAITPNIIEPDSHHLQANTNYIVFVRVHNASTDAAIGVRVRLLYRPWSFNSPNLLPVDVDSNGNEVVRFVNVPPMGATITQYNWHTPAPDPGETSKHICIQVHLHHPMDINPQNNIGQENTRVYKSSANFVHAGELLNFNLLLHNTHQQAMRFSFEADSYSIQEDKIELKLKRNRGTEKWATSDKIINAIPTLQKVRTETGERKPRLVFGARKPLEVTRARYTGYEAYRDNLRKTKFPLPDGFVFTPPDNIELSARETREIPFTLKVSPDAQDGQQFTVNIKATTANGYLMGGVTLLLKIKN